MYVMPALTSAAASTDDRLSSVNPKPPTLVVDPIEGIEQRPAFLNPVINGFHVHTNSSTVLTVDSPCVVGIQCVRA